MSERVITLLPFHPAADIFPLMEGKELDELAGDIKRRGQHVPIITHNGEIIDGRNRARACQKAGVEPRYADYQGKDEDIVRFIVSLNVHRRHLKPEGRREVLKSLLLTNPEKSNRQVAKEAGVDHKTVAAVRTESERRGEIPHVKIRKDTKGRAQPAKKKRRTEDDSACDVRATKAADPAPVKPQLMPGGIGPMVSVEVELVDSQVDAARKAYVAAMETFTELEKRKEVGKLEKALGLRDPIPATEKPSVH